MSQLRQRAWGYVLGAYEYEMAGCECGCARPQWSEYEGHLWCPVCCTDFIPKHNGVFDGPIPYEMAKLLGFNFDRYDLTTQQIIKFEDYHEQTN